MVCLLPGSTAQGQISGSPHDLSGYSWTGGQICLPCHAAHGGMGGMLWNHTYSTLNYDLHAGLDAVDYGQPGDPSDRCLSCHDGSVAVDDFGGSTSSPPSYFLTGKVAFGTDLTIHHPVSFTFDTALANADGALHDPATTPSGLGGTIAQDLLRGGKVECATCHDPHRNTLGRFLEKPIYGRGAQLCNTCHFDSGPANHHIPRRDDPWGVGNCTSCHGVDLMGKGHAPACTNCHNSFAAPDAPASGHHVPGRDQPFANHCTDCHGGDLLGGLGPSCYECHDKIWSGNTSQATPPASHNEMHGGAAHMPGGLDPYNSGCTTCHGPNLDDGFATACSHCHDPAWNGHNFTGKPWLPANKPYCFPCHDGPDWNHTLSPTQNYTVSRTTLSAIGDPNGKSQECLSCHEGNLAVDDFHGTLSDGQQNFLTAATTFGTDLTQHHPVSFDYSDLLVLAHGALNDPNTAPSGLPAAGTIAEDLLENGEVQCTSCHNQHGSGRDLLHKTPRGGLCFTCHDERPPVELLGTHHIPRREAPWGNAFSCTECHGSDLKGAGAAPACVTCHTSFSNPDAPPVGHHGDDRFNPIENCSVCHGASLHGNLQFANVNPPSCYRCHGNLWSGVPVVDPGGPYRGLVGERITFDAGATTDDGGLANLTFEWLFGDGSDPLTPARGVATTSHVYTTAGTFTGFLSVSDGTSRVVLKEFTVVITDPVPPPVKDDWRVTVQTPREIFNLSIDKKGTSGDGTFVAVKDDSVNVPSLAMGVEFSGVIFWLDIWMDVNANVKWGTGDMFFGNIDRQLGTMSGVAYGRTGSISSFSAISHDVIDP